MRNVWVEFLYESSKRVGCLCYISSEDYIYFKYNEYYFKAKLLPEIARWFKDYRTTYIQTSTIYHNWIKDVELISELERALYV